MDDATPEKRIGDRERREVDERLRAAEADGMLTLLEYDERSRQCFAARTRSELAALTADLPDPVPPERPVPAPPPPSPSVRPHVPERRRQKGVVRGGLVPALFLALVAFLGIRVLGADDGTAFFGQHIVQVADTDRPVEVGALFGRTEVVVPNGVQAQQEGGMIFGSVRCEQACAVAPGAPTARPLQVDARGGFGSVEIVTPAEAAQGGLSDRDDDDD